MMEDNKEEENDDNYPMYPEYGGTTMEDNEEEEAIEWASDEPVDDLGRAIADARIDCESEKEREKLERMLDDHKKLLYLNCEDGQKSWIAHWNCCNQRQRLVYLTRDLKSC
jgi:hypothetical protein